MLPDLIDPFTGEGIGNAMCSAKIGAEVIAKAVKENRYDEAFLAEYGERVWKRLGGELDLSLKMRNTAR